jgi:hypothetical protein
VLNKWGVSSGLHVDDDYDDDDPYWDPSTADRSIASGGVERKDLTWCLDISHREVVGVPGAPVQSRCCRPWSPSFGRWWHLSNCGGGRVGGIAGIMDAFSAAVILVVIPSAKDRAQALQKS